MIIRRLQAENILKFTRLNITFPENGTILISGDNESGKSAIIETICLGLFGRTANLDHHQTSKVIHWGNTRGWIALDFTDTKGQNLTVYRHFSRQDPPQARLNAEGVDEAMALGEKEVNQAIVQAAGMAFHHFIETIYLSQGSPEGEDPNAIVRMVAGVEDLDLLSAQLETEIKAERDQINRISAELSSASQELNSLNLQPGLLGEKQQKLNHNMAQKATLEADIKNRTQRLDTLGSGAKAATAALSATIQQGHLATLAAWNQNLKNLQSALSTLASLNLGEAAAIIAKLRGKTQHTLESLVAFSTIVDKTIQDGKSRSHWLSGTDIQTLAGEQQHLDAADQLAAKGRSRGIFTFLFFVILALPVGGIGFALNFFPQDPRLAPVVEMLATTFPDYQTIHLQGAMGLGVLFLLIALLGLGKSIKNIAMKSQNKQTRYDLLARAEAEQKIVAIIAETAQLPLCQQIHRLSSLEDQVPWNESLQQWQQSQGRDLVDEKKLSSFLNGWNEDFGQLKTLMETIIKNLDHELHQANDLLSNVNNTIPYLEKEIHGELERHKRDQELRKRCESLKESRTQISHDIDIQTLARQLIQDSAHEISLGFSIELRRLIAKTTPLFTRGRYQHLRIDEDLNLSAFSPTKNDFVDMSETSRGLRRQLMLALRLALAQALTARSQTQSQFMILDEPFAHYDHDRFRESYQALGNVSDAIQQTFIVSQSFDEDLAETATLHLRCQIETNVMEWVSP
ncbi:MAG: AAA family ATPase [Nitrospirae bacterium]|nr:AAA family ATPase [Magnetococcales bacterium]HAT49986.1 hypothetical protein [Alphaproteobacteria bacterium]